MSFQHKEFRESAVGKKQYALMVNARRNYQKQAETGLIANSGLTDQAWVEIDKTILGLRDEVKGQEIVDFLTPVIRPVHLGKFQLEYTTAGDIDQSIVVDIDGATPVTYDHTDYSSGADPIPMFHGGFGVNARQEASYNSIGLSLATDSQAQKIKAFHRKIVDYTLRGASNIIQNGAAAQGLLNHRNTQKIDLGAGGANVDLTTATPAQLEAFFINVFSKVIDDNELGDVTAIFFSPEAFRNISRSWAIATNGDGQGTVLDRIRPYMRVAGTGNEFIKMSYALSGNEFVAIKRERQYVEKPVGQGMIVLPRTRENFLSPLNFDIYEASGISVKADYLGRSGVIYAGENA